MVVLLRGTSMSWCFLSRTWSPVTDLQHYYLARYLTDDWHLANTPRKSIPVKQAYFSVVVCLRVLCHHSVSSWLGPCVIVWEPADVYITSRVQKVWVVRCANGPLEITQWWFLSVPVRAFGLGVRPKWPRKWFKLHFRVHRWKWCQTFRCCTLIIDVKFLNTGSCAKSI